MEEIADYYPLGKTSFSDKQKKLNDFTVSDWEKKILKELGKRKLDYAEMHVNQEKIELWKDLNVLKRTRPLVWINEIPWHEMDVDDELKLKTENRFAQFLETRLRRSIYLWEHMPVDSVIEPTIPCYLVVDNSGFGISELAEVAITNKESDIISRGFNPQIQCEEDLEKIKFPVITLDEKSTKEKYEVMSDIFNGILNVEKKGIPGFWFAPWDELIRLWGVQEALIDLTLKPDLVHKVMGRFTEAYLHMLDQYEKQNLLALNNCNYRIGSGGLGYTDELPGVDFKKSNIKTVNMWGCGAAQIFEGVSPEMHYEFSLQYEIKWMKRFGLNYYGCCEPLHKKLKILEKIPNLRKISMSSWVNLEEAAFELKNDYVFSYKPSPVIFTDNKWDKIEIKERLRKDLRILRNCRVEIIMKDISTINYKPQRLWDWGAIALEISKEFE